MNLRPLAVTLCATIVACAFGACAQGSTTLSDEQWEWLCRASYHPEDVYHKFFGWWRDIHVTDGSLTGKINVRLPDGSVPCGSLRVDVQIEIWNAEGADKRMEVDGFTDSAMTDRGGQAAFEISFPSERGLVPGIYTIVAKIRKDRNATGDPMMAECRPEIGEYDHLSGDVYGRLYFCEGDWWFDDGRIKALRDIEKIQQQLEAQQRGQSGHMPSRE